MECPAGEPNICELSDGTTDPRVRHAEINALKKLTRSQESSIGSVLFITDSPCAMCALEISEAKVAAVVFERPYRDTSGIKFLMGNGVAVFRVDSENNRILEYCNYDGNEYPVIDEYISF